MLSIKWWCLDLAELSLQNSWLMPPPLISNRGYIWDSLLPWMCMCAYGQVFCQIMMFTNTPWFPRSPMGITHIMRSGCFYLPFTSFLFCTIIFFELYLQHYLSLWKMSVNFILLFLHSYHRFIVYPIILHFFCNILIVSPCFYIHWTQLLHFPCWYENLLYHIY